MHVNEYIAKYLGQEVFRNGFSYELNPYRGLSDILEKAWNQGFKMAEHDATKEIKHNV